MLQTARWQKGPAQPREDREGRIQCDRNLNTATYSLAVPNGDDPTDVSRRRLSAFRNAVLHGRRALSRADDILDLAVAAILVRLLGWHWEFLPAFAAELIPGVDLVLWWTFAATQRLPGVESCLQPRIGQSTPRLP